MNVLNQNSPAPSGGSGDGGQAQGPAVPAETLALICAAVALSLKKPHKIAAVHHVQLDAPVYILNPWSMEGRFQHFGSHKLR